MKSPPISRKMHVFHGSAFYVTPQWRDALATIGLSEEQDWTQLQSKDVVSGSYNTTSNFRFELTNGQTVYFKRYVYRKPRLKHWLQPSKAAVEAAGFHELKTLGIPTIQTLAYGEQRQFGILKAAFIVTLGIPDVVEIDQYLARIWFRKAYAEKQTILHKLQPLLIQQLQTAHRAGFFHWDLKLRNLLVTKPVEDKPDIIWIDCPRSRRKKADDVYAIITDLAAMARVGCRVLTPAQQFRFLLNYCDNNRQQARQLYRGIAQALEKRPPRPYWQLLAQDDPLYIKNKKEQR